MNRRGNVEHEFGFLVKAVDLECSEVCDGMARHLRTEVTNRMVEGEVGSARGNVFTHNECDWIPHFSTFTK